MNSQAINWMFAIVVSGTAGVGLVFAYWNLKLLKRIGSVARNQHPIPENVFWPKRMRLAIESDEICQALVKRRNRWAIAFFCALGGVGALMAYVVFTVDIA